MRTNRKLSTQLLKIVVISVIYNCMVIGCSLGFSVIWECDGLLYIY